MGVDNEDVMDALEDALEAEDTLPGGGVPVMAVVQRLPIGRTSTNKRLRQLVEEGRVKKGLGIPKGGRPQPTYVPSATED